MRSNGLFGAVLTSGFLLVPATLASATVIPVTAGKIDPPAYNDFAKGFDSQPAVDPVVGDTSDPGGSTVTLFYPDRLQEAGYVDFGTGYAGVTINGAFALLHQWGVGTNNVPYQYAWSNEITNTGFSDRGTYYTSAPDFGLFTYSGADSDKQWVQTYNNPTGVTPAARYLIVFYDVASTAGLTSSNRADEFVFTTSVPEPASLSLLSLGGLALLRRRRAAV